MEGTTSDFLDEDLGLNIGLKARRSLMTSKDDPGEGRRTEAGELGTSFKTGEMVD